MAQLPGTFNPDEHEDEFDLLPAGKYLAQVIASEINPTTRGDGEMLKLTFEVIEGPCERRQTWERLNIVNPNADAQRIAQASLAKLCRALGLGPIDDTEALHFKPVVIDVGIRPSKDPQYRDQNTIKNYLPADGANTAPPPRQQSSAPRTTTQQRPAATQQTTRPTANGSGRPWGNRASA